jgi:hypothetical protein
MPLYVPAYIESAPELTQHVLVQSGTNWDLSRTERVTPFVVLLDPQPAPPPDPPPPPAQFGADDGIPAGPPLLVVHFTHEGVAIHAAERRALLKLLTSRALIVAAHGDAQESDADRLSRVRAKAVVNLLRSKGYTVTRVKAFGSRRPPTDGTTECRPNRCVQVFAANDPL